MSIWDFIPPVTCDTAVFVVLSSSFSWLLSLRVVVTPARLFDRAAADHFDSTINHGTPLKDKCFRCKNNSDIVTSVPGSPYVHVGTEIFLDQ